MTEVLTSLDAILAPSRSALLVVDVQNDFIHPEGWAARHSPGGPSLRHVIPPINRLIRAARTARVPVVYILMEHGPALDPPQLPGALRGAGDGRRHPVRGRRLGRPPRCGDPSAGARRPHDRPPLVRRVRGHRAPRAPARARRRVGGRNGRGHQSVRADDDPARIRPRLLRGDRRGRDGGGRSDRAGRHPGQLPPVLRAGGAERDDRSALAPAHDSRFRGAAPA